MGRPPQSQGRGVAPDGGHLGQGLRHQHPHCLHPWPQVRAAGIAGLEGQVAKGAARGEEGIEILGLQPQLLHLGPPLLLAQVALLHEAVPGRPPQLALLALLQFGEVGPQPGLQGPLAQELAAEGVDGADETPVQPPQGLLRPPRRLSPPAGLLPQAGGKAGPHLPGGLAGEGDGRHLLDQPPSGADPGGHPLHQGLGLARPGAGQHHQVLVQVPGNGRPGFLIPQHLSHRPTA